MIYKCQKVSIDRLPVLPTGSLEPLCNTCITKDCDNPIESVQISIFGITKTMKGYNVNGKPSFVYECEGYINERYAGNQSRSIDINGIQPLSQKQTDSKSVSTENDTDS